MIDIKVTGAGDFAKASRALKNAGQTGVRKEFNKRVLAAVRPLTPATRAVALARLPKRGGLASQVASEPQRVQLRTGRDPGISLIVGKKRGAARSTNEGTIRHPVFGRGAWVSQSVPPGWFDQPTKAAGPQVRQAVTEAMQDVVNNIVKEA